MIDNLQTRIDAVFAVVLHATSNGAVALFDIAIMVSLVFWIFEIIRAMQSGGGAIFETLGKRILILLALTAFVNGWESFVTVIRDDIVAFAGHVANVDPLVAGTTGQFTPDSILATNAKLTDAIYSSGAGMGIAAYMASSVWKLAAITLVQIGSAVLALDLFVGDISLDLVFASCAMLLGLIATPWLSSFAMSYIALIISTSVYVILIGVFCAIGETIALLAVQSANAMPHGSMMPGPHMLEIGILSLGFACLAWMVPAWVASRIGGGAPIAQMGSVIGSGISMAASGPGRMAAMMRR